MPGNARMPQVPPNQPLPRTAAAGRGTGTQGRIMVTSTITITSTLVTLPPVTCISSHHHLLHQMLLYQNARKRAAIMSPRRLSSYLAVQIACYRVRSICLLYLHFRRGGLRWMNGSIGGFFRGGSTPAAPGGRTTGAGLAACWADAPSGFGI